MTEFLKVNEFGKAFGFDRVLEFQQQLITQATEVNKKIAVEFLKTAKAAVDVYARNLDTEIKRLDNRG